VKLASSARNYCEIDVLNTYWIYLHYQLMRGQLNHSALLAETQLLQESGRK
jgi:3'-5' exonuclease